MEQETKFETMFKERNPHHSFLISRLQCAIGKEHVDFSDINTENMRKFRDYLDGEVSANSLRTYFAAFGAYVRECQNDGYITNVKCLSALRVKKTPQQNVALTEDEVQRIYDYYKRMYGQESVSQAEKDVLTLFLIECYCGARGSDVEDFTMDNIQDGMLSYVSKKTKILATMPAHKYLPKLISRIPKRQYARFVKNRIIKRVCERVGIIEPVTIYYHGRSISKPKYFFTAFHTARRSFASILAAKGAPVSEISQFMSHSSTLMTDRYIKVDTKNASMASMAFFKG